MKATTPSALLALLATTSVEALPKLVARDVYTNYPYNGPAIPVGDWVNNGAVSNGKGYPRLVEPPAVTPGMKNPKNNINVISMSYLPDGMMIHFQTPFGLGTAPSILWGAKKAKLNMGAFGTSTTYDRTPPCSMMAVTQCSQFFHNVPITGLKAGTTYYYSILAANGTTRSKTMSFTTAKAAGTTGSFSVAVLNDMGYTNAAGTMSEIDNLVKAGDVAFAWHGGDLSYADDWYSGILPCEDSWPVCYNGSSSRLPPGDVPPVYSVPLPKGEVASQGSPNGGDMSVLYESNWDLWQQWLNPVTTTVPYMTVPGNHEASCIEFDGPGNPMTAYLNNNETNSTAPASALTYYSCPESQRNFTAYSNRFKMPGDESGGLGGFWYSFDYGLAHFVSFDSETDFVGSPEYPFLRDLHGSETMPTPAETYPTDSGPFGNIDGGQAGVNNVTAYEQYQWMARDLASVNRTKTPWIIAIAHRPMYSTETASYQKRIRTSFQSLMLQYGVDVFIAGHIHWYERLFPLTVNGTVDTASVVDNNTYYANPGVSMTHIVNGQAGNIESHSTLDPGEALLPITSMLDDQHYGFTKLTVFNGSALQMQFIRGDGAGVGDEVMILKH